MTRAISAGRDCVEGHQVILACTPTGFDAANCSNVIVIPRAAAALTTLCQYFDGIPRSNQWLVSFASTSISLARGRRPPNASMMAEWVCIPHAITTFCLRRNRLFVVGRNFAGLG